MQSIATELILSLIAAIIGATTPASDPGKTLAMCEQAPAAQCSPSYLADDEDGDA